MTKAEQLRKPKRGNKKSSLEKKLDKLWTTAVLLKCNHKCIICGKSEGLNAHHIEGRRNKRLRWEIFNGVALCTLHHVFGKLSAHQAPEWFHIELEDKRWQDLQQVTLHRYEDIDLSVEALKERIKFLENYINTKRA